MIAIDASSFRRYLDGIDAPDTRAVSHAIATGQATLPPAALAELFSEPTLDPDAVFELDSIDVLRIKEGYWRRAGKLRAFLRQNFGVRVKLPDTLIAQACLDHDVPLITYDAKLRRQFVRVGLRVL